MARLGRLLGSTFFSLRCLLCCEPPSRVFLSLLTCHAMLCHMMAQIRKMEGDYDCDTTWKWLCSEWGC